jgi:colanic acid biosynthesis glycosyl transferase WcaI
VDQRTNHAGRTFTSVLSKLRVGILYQYFYPDDVVSARHYADLAEGLRDRGCQVQVWTSNRACRDESVCYQRDEVWRGIRIHRIWKPRFKSGSSIGRVISIAWMIAAWTVILWRRQNRPDVVIVGTDPPLSLLTALTVRLVWPGARFAHWCFDVYPEAAVADGMLAPNSPIERFLKKLVRRAYGNIALIADVGDCMRKRLETYGHRASSETLVPWALVEPENPGTPDPAIRRNLFGDAALGLLYSGNFGRAHSHEAFFELARSLKSDNMAFAFGIRGNRTSLVRQSLRPDDANVRIVDFASEAELEVRLSAADIHLVSLRPEWNGLVVPSKFFGSLAAGRPVIFAGPADSDIARWIREHRVGWILNRDSSETIAKELRALAASRDCLKAMQSRCHCVYQEHFAKKVVLDRWDEALRSLIHSRAALSGGGPS